MEVSTLLLDTNAYSAFALGNKHVQQIMGGYERVAFPFIVIGELLFGFKRGTREKQNREQLSDLISMQSSEVLYADSQTPEHYSSIAVELRKKGRPIPSNDIWIAALARQFNLPVCTNDTDFDAVNGLTILKYRSQ